MSLFMISKFWSLTKLIYCLLASAVLLEAQPTIKERQYLYVEVVVDSKNCTYNEDRWTLQQQIVFETLNRHPELGLSGSGRYCGCILPNQTVCEKEPYKAVELLMYESKTEFINADESTLVSLEKELEQIPPGIVTSNVQPFYDCSNLQVITANNPEYKRCQFRIPDVHVFNNTMTNSQANTAGPTSGTGTATIVGAALGALAGLGLLAGLVWFVFRHIKKGSQVDDAGSSSDIKPIVPGGVGFGEAPNSVPPAGTS